MNTWMAWRIPKLPSFPPLPRPFAAKTLTSNDLTALVDPETRPVRTLFTALDAGWAKWVREDFSSHCRLMGTLPNLWTVAHGRPSGNDYTARGRADTTR